MATTKRPKFDVRPSGSVRIKWRYEGRQTGITLDSEKEAMAAWRWLNTHGRNRPGDDPDLLWAVGRKPKPQVADPGTLREALERACTMQETQFGPKPLKANSVRSYRSMVKTYLEPLADRTIASLTRADIENLMADMTAGGASPARCANVAILLQKALGPSGRAELVRGYAVRVKGRKRPTQILSKTQMDLVVMLGADHGIGDLLRLICGTGLRFGEAAGARREHAMLLDTDAPYLELWEQYTAVSHVEKRRNGTPLEPETLKTERSYRKIPLGHELASWIREQGPGLLTRDPKTGGPWQHHVAIYRLSKVSADAMAEGIIQRPLTFHDLRHSYGTVLRQFLEPVQAAAVMGHSPAMNATTYGHLSPVAEQMIRQAFK